MQPLRFLCWLGMHDWEAPQWVDNSEGWVQSCLRCGQMKHIAAPSFADQLKGQVRPVAPRRRERRYKLTGPTMRFDV